MKAATPLILGFLIVVVGVDAAIDQIWLSPINVTAQMNAGVVYMDDYPDAPKGEWTNITTGISGRTGYPIVQIDSKGLIWVFAGLTQLNYFTAVWNYDPKTDLYRWMFGSVKNGNLNPNYGEFGIPSPDSYPFGVFTYSASTIDLDDNIWFYGARNIFISKTYEFWRFNTTSFEFTYFGLMNGTTVKLPPPIMVTAKGVPSPLNYPGTVEGGVLLTDSKNNLWLYGGFASRGDPTSAIWHFNTTSFEWTWMFGSISTTDYIDYNNNFLNGRFKPGAFMDSDDRIWVFGGLGRTIDQSAIGEWNDIWSFDTKTLQWRVEWKVNTTGKLFDIRSTVVSDDYHPGNIPSARTGAQIVDRLDGTLMFAGGEISSTVPQSDIWLFNKTSKMWKMVHGIKDGADGAVIPSNYTNYRQVGGQLGSRRMSGCPSGPNNRGHYIIYGGEDSVTPLNDIWVIPQDPCFVCDVNAECTSIDIWSDATCTCKQGYSGDGKTCTADAVPVAPVAPVAVPVSSTGPVAKTPHSKPITSDASALVASFGLVATISALF